MKKLLLFFYLTGIISFNHAAEAKVEEWYHCPKSTADVCTSGGCHCNVREDNNHIWYCSDWDNDSSVYWHYDPKTKLCGNISGKDNCAWDCDC